MGIDTAIVGKFEPNSKPKVMVGTSDGRVLILDPNTTRKHLISPNDGFRLPLPDSAVINLDHSDSFRTNQIGMLDWNGDGIKEIFAVGADKEWAPSRLVILDKEMEPLYDYWSHGGIVEVFPVDIDGDKEDELVVWAYDNIRMDDYGGLPLCIALLDRSMPSGQAPDSVYPYVPAGVPKWYLTWLLPSSIKHVKIEIRKDYGYSHFVVRVHTMLGLMLYIDSFGNVYKAERSVYLRYAHRRIEADTTPEPWLLKVERRNGKVIETPIPLKWQLKLWGIIP